MLAALRSFLMQASKPRLVVIAPRTVQDTIRIEETVNDRRLIRWALGLRVVNFAVFGTSLIVMSNGASGHDSFHTVLCLLGFVGVMYALARLAPRIVRPHQSYHGHGW